MYMSKNIIVVLNTDIVFLTCNINRLINSNRRSRRIWRCMMDQESIFVQQLLRLTKKLKRQRYLYFTILITNINNNKKDPLHSMFIDFKFCFIHSCQQNPPNLQVSTLVPGRHSTEPQTVEEPLEPHICLMERHLYKHTFSQHLKHQIMYQQHSLIHPVIHQIQIKTLLLLEQQQHSNQIR